MNQGVLLNYLLSFVLETEIHDLAKPVYRRPFPSKNWRESLSSRLYCPHQWIMMTDIKKTYILSDLGKINDDTPDIKLYLPFWKVASCVASRTQIKILALIAMIPSSNYMTATLATTKSVKNERQKVVHFVLGNKKKLA